MVIAREWREQLQTGRDELLVYIQPRKSSAFLYEGVEAALKELDPEAAQLLRPIPDWGIVHYLEQIKTSGVILVDDWAILGSGLGKTISTLKGYGLSAERLHIHLLSASTHVLKNSIAGVAPKTHFTFPFGIANPRDALTSIVGTHAKPILGFTHSMQLLYGGIRQKQRATRTESEPPTEAEAMPLLYSGFPVYDPTRLTGRRDVEYRLSRAEHTLLSEQCARVETAVRLAERAIYGDEGTTRI